MRSRARAKISSENLQWGLFTSSTLVLQKTNQQTEMIVLQRIFQVLFNFVTEETAQMFLFFGMFELVAMPHYNIIIKDFCNIFAVLSIIL